MINLKNELDMIQISYSDHMIEQLLSYMDGILEWNEKVNITAIRERDEFIEKHYIDSLLCNNCSEFVNAKSVIDVGTGGGFPGIPLAILNPDKEFLLMDSLNKRLKIIEQLCNEIGIMNVKVLHSRAEDAGRNRIYREKFDICVSRAVANMSTLAELCIPFVNKDGYFLAYKGPDTDAEINDALKAIKLIGGTVDRVEDASSPSSDLHHKIVYIKKIKNTPAKFPRKAGTPAKDPVK